jgi:hypothetical protein
MKERADHDDDYDDDDEYDDHIVVDYVNDHIVVDDDDAISIKHSVVSNYCHQVPRFK